MIIVCLAVDRLVVDSAITEIWNARQKI